MPEIPRRIHVIWVGSPLPDHYRRYLATWYERNPGWRVDLWTDTNRPKLANEKVYQRLHVPALRADVLRLELLAKFGGLYSDADSECLRPLDGLLEGVETAGMIDRLGRVCVATMATTPGHPAFASLVDGVSDRYEWLRAHPKNRARGWSGHTVMGTRYVTPALFAVPGFYRIPRDLVASRGNTCERTYISHDHAGSWKRQLGGTKVRLR